MFDQYYQHHLIDSKERPETHILHRWTYNFHTHHRRYICLVELFPNHIYVVKYYADAHSQSKNKYRLLFNDERPTRIIRTCINIMLEHLHQDPNASFGFVATSSVNKKGKEEKRAYNQRFRVYRSVMINFFGSSTFHHSQNKAYSSYLLINRNQKPIIRFKRQAEKMFTLIYRDLRI